MKGEMGRVMGGDWERDYRDEQMVIAFINQWNYEVLELCQKVN